MRPLLPKRRPGRGVVSLRAILAGGEASPYRRGWGNSHNAKSVPARNAPKATRAAASASIMPSAAHRIRAARRGWSGNSRG